MDMRLLVDLPAGLDYNEWLASHSECLKKLLILGLLIKILQQWPYLITWISFTDQLASFVQPVVVRTWQDLDKGSCHYNLIFFWGCMCNFRTYLWFDEKGKKTKVAAPQYIDYVMTFIQKTISDENIFPTKYGLFIN